MAQVLAPIVQTTGAITMPYSSSDGYANPPPQPHQQPRSPQMPRNHSHSSGPGYRGTSTPIAPYAFASTPPLLQENRAVSAPQPPGSPQAPSHVNHARLGHPSHPSSSSDSTVSTSSSSNRSIANPSQATKDAENRKPEDNIASSITLSTSNLDLSFSVGDAPVKPSPGRYRRGAAGRTDSSTSIPTAATTPTQRSAATTPTQASQPLAALPADLSAPAKPGHTRTISADDSSVARPSGGDAAKRYRRRSFNGLDGNALAANMGAMQLGTTTAEATTSAPPAADSSRPASSSGKQATRPVSSHSHDRQDSAGSASSNTSSSRPQSRSEASAPRTYASVAGGSASKATEAARRHAPSPLSHPISPSEPPSPARPQGVPSAAVQQLTAVNDKGKGMKSRLRRAFSFGSAAELRRASAENSISAERAKLRKDRYQTDDVDAEQAAIIAKQEAAGIGAGIYSGQGGMGSTDNLSVASAASSASIMLRKMGQGMKKGSKSIKGLFRPKSVIGVPAADGPITRPSVGEVSLVTVEAERQKVNVNADPHDHIRGGTGYPRLERNSIDAGRSAEMGHHLSTDAMARKSIVGSDRERAEVLSNIKKGILKRNGTGSDAGSPVLRPTDKAPSFRSNSPSTPNDKRSSRNEDYFVRAPRIPNGSTRSLPSSPHGHKGNITFSPRIQFHDAWSPQDYDRRGDIATCNRLTPMLAQQIKEELNSFKMEMEVHELSKPHTHFF
ncbi:bud neck involved protein [Pleosporales sp. CAS-2024a]